MMTLEVKANGLQSLRTNLLGTGIVIPPAPRTLYLSTESSKSQFQTGVSFPVNVLKRKACYPALLFHQYAQFCDSKLCHHYFFQNFTTSLKEIFSNLSLKFFNLPSFGLRDVMHTSILKLKHPWFKSSGRSLFHIIALSLYQYFLSFSIMHY